jgi:hypothetical protein
MFAAAAAAAAAVIDGVMMMNGGGDTDSYAFVVTKKRKNDNELISYAFLMNNSNIKWETEPCEKVLFFYNNKYIQ